MVPCSISLSPISHLCTLFAFVEVLSCAEIILIDEYNMRGNSAIINMRAVLSMKSVQTAMKQSSGMQGMTVGDY